VVERNCADIVVQDVSLDDSVKQLSTNETKFSIDRGSRSSSVRPALASVVRKRRVGVLEIGDGNQPVVDPKIWKPVPDKHVEVTKLLAEGVEDSPDNGEAKIAEQDQLGVSCLVQRAVRVEVVDTAEPTIALAFSSALSLVFVVVVTGDVDENVQGPSRKLLADQFQRRRDRGLLCQLVELVGKMTDFAGIYFSCLGNENHVPLHVTGSLVVLAVRDLPREIWH